MRPPTPTPGRISIGNAEDFSHGPTRGWFVGSFLDAAAGPRLTDQIEMKWGRHPSGDTRTQLSEAADTTSVAILISGRFELAFPGEQPDHAVLHRQGDFVLYGPGVPHSWRAVTDSVILTVRWQPQAVAV